jgi:hypothetical protein
VNGGGDFLSSLPEGILHHVLYFLPPHEAVRTSRPCSPASGATSGGR